MPRSTGQKPGHADSAAPAGYGWAELLEALVAEHGTLAAVAWKLLERGEGPEDVASVERALRRLRTRGQRDGGTWGQRLLRVFGVPAPVEARLVWMGLYHSPFNDLPVSLCRDQLRLWDRPPISASRARLWLRLGFATLALRERAFEEAGQSLAQARRALAGTHAGQDAARVEIPLAEAYLASRLAPERVEGLLEEARGALASAALPAGDAACFRARLVDQRAFALNRLRTPEGEAEALGLYEALPREDEHPFASYRREAGLAWGYLRAGRRDEALACARLACRHAGDGGYVRLRVMGLLMQAKILGLAAGGESLGRAREIAVRLEDPELLGRVSRFVGEG